ncbi:hypothetical protein OPV22_007791 [Ensete ventricosum]|uniref:dolichyl-P-Man:Man5GlcNAc2-PP-dolichol alpha-1,3-mannosyltransferase n=1 Tax=Ensete ventricosum TaxID=4639 RepID=A0AAV8R6T5_ENSVE|nr:hypothetical protein OPV22_007791 [Ensete ventricosum]
MSQVDGFLGGERDCTKLKGDTGPLVYPAGFLYVYSAIKFLTGGEVFPCSDMSVSIFVTLLLVILLGQLPCGAVSIKVNVLLYAPPRFLLLLNIILGLAFLLTYPSSILTVPTTIFCNLYDCLKKFGDGMG